MGKNYVKIADRLAHPSGESRVCPACKGTFYRKARQAPSLWDPQVFCSRTCGSRKVKMTKSVFYKFFTPEPNSGCWLWDGRVNRAGYGVLGTNNQKMLAHRFSWEMHRGQIPRGQGVLHHCDNPPCVNPDHLFLGAPIDNVRDMHAKGRARKLRGEQHPSAKLTAAQVDAIRADTRKQRDVAKEYGVGASTISMIRTGKNWISR